MKYTAISFCILVYLSSGASGQTFELHSSCPEDVAEKCNESDKQAAEIGSSEFYDNYSRKPDFVIKPLRLESANAEGIESRTSPKQVRQDNRRKIETISNQMERMDWAYQRLANELISAADESANNGQAIAEVMQSLEERFSEFQRQVRKENKSLANKANRYQTTIQHLDHHFSRTRKLFIALENDLEEIRQRILKLERQDLFSPTEILNSK